MPISLRTVEPASASLDRIPPERTRDELQCVANGTLTNLIRQLSSLSTHGEQLFTDMLNEVDALNRRLDQVMIRTVRLNEKVEKGARTVRATGRLAENNMRKAFRSANLIDQHSLSRQTMPQAMVELYDQCEPPPDLHLFDEFRPGLKPALKLYTDPGYFFELWKQEILKECGIDKKIQKVRHQQQGLQQQQSPRKRMPEEPKRPQHNSRVLLSHYTPSQTNNLVLFPTEYQAPQINRHVPYQVPAGMVRPAQLARPTQAAPSLPNHVFDDEPLPPPPSTQNPVDPPRADLVTPSSAAPPPSDRRPPLDHLAALNQTLPEIDAQLDEDDELPPPPPPLATDTMMQYLPPPMQLGNANNGLVTPRPAQSQPTNPPPPPPPPPSTQAKIAESLLQSSFGPQSEGQGQDGPEGTQPNSTGDARREEDKQEEQNPRSNLLAEIQSGYKLRKVQRREESNKARAAVEANDVAAILMRRAEHVLGNDDSSEENQSDDDEWDDN